MVEDNNVEQENVIGRFDIDVAQAAINDLVVAVNQLQDHVHYLEERFYSHEHNTKDGHVVFRWNKKE